MHHSDRGSPYASDDYRAELAHQRRLRQHEPKGKRLGQRVAESFFATLRAELIDRERYPTRASAIRAIGDYIDNFYNIQRRHSHLDYLSPVEFELRSQVRRAMA